VEGTPFTVVVALQEKQIGYKVKIPERYQNLNTTRKYNLKNILYLLAKHKINKISKPKSSDSTKPLQKKYKTSKLCMF